MAGARLSFEERKAVLKWYLKFENISEVQRQWRNEFGTQPLTRLTIARIRDKLEIDGTVGDVHKERSGRPRTATTQLPPLQCYNNLHVHHKSLWNSVHVKPELVDQLYNEFWKVRSGRCTFQDCCMYEWGRHRSTTWVLWVVWKHDVWW